MNSTSNPIQADRFIEPETTIERTVQYGLDHYPELDKEEHWQRTLDHLHEKYAEGGYLKLWFSNFHGEKSANFSFKLLIFRDFCKHNQLKFRCLTA